MVNGIVDIMRMEDGKMPNNPEVTDLGALIKGRVDQYCSAAITNGVNLTHHIGRTVGSYLTDGALLARVIDNLVVNAIKHTRQGGNIIISAQRQPDNGLVIAVTDTGEGIPPEALSGLFQKYGRVEGQQLGRTYDSGLGLVFCKMAVELLGGSIGVTSARDEGTSFTMAFPPE